MHNLAKRKTTFLHDIPFIRLCFTINTSKCIILQKGKRLFCKIFHLLVYPSSLLVNAQSCKKRKRLFCKIFHLLVYVSLLILVNAILQKGKRPFCDLFIAFISAEKRKFTQTLNVGINSPTTGNA